jgi:hypothetical protein
LFDARDTPTRVCLKISRPADTAAQLLDHSPANRLCSPAPSLTMRPGAAEYIVKVPSGASSPASPAGDGRENGARTGSCGRRQDDDLDPRPFAVQLRQDRVDADPIPPNVGLGPNLRADRDEVGLSRGLNAEAIEVDQRDSSTLDFCR